MSGPHPTSDRPRATPHPRQESATDVVRWAAFSCVLVPVVLLWYGSSLAGAAGTAFGLAAVTAVCRLLLHRSERGAAEHAEHMDDADCVEHADCADHADHGDHMHYMHHADHTDHADPDTRGAHDTHGAHANDADHGELARYQGDQAHRPHHGHRRAQPEREALEAAGAGGARRDDGEREERTVPQQGHRQRTGAAVRRDGRHTGGSTPVV